MNLYPSLRKLSLAALVAVVSVICPRVILAGPPSGYHLDWADEFNGPSLDDNTWNIISGSRHSAVNTPDAVAVTNGCLVISSYTTKGIHYTGFVDTKGKVYKRYGYYEARIQFQNAPGNWSAFWLQSDGILHTNRNPADGVEIDIIEHRNTDKKGRDLIGVSESALHYNGYHAAEVSTNIVTGDLGLSSGFHTYGFLWTSNKYEFYVDDRLTWAPANYMISTSPEFVRLTSEIFNHGWAGDIPTNGYPGSAATPLKMYVDYVRYYAPNGAAN